VRNKLIQMTKEPLIQFLFIGACIYGAYALFGAPDDDVANSTIVVDARRIDGFIGEWERRWNRPPTRQELDGVINAFVREDILYRQAVAMGLDADDPITRRRMAQKLEFLTNDIALLKEPAEGELEQYFQANMQAYLDPDLITFSHAYLDPDRREAATLDDAAALLSQLQAAEKPDPESFEAGDRFMLESYYPEVSELDIRRQFGTGFSEAVMKLEPGKWHGPVLSGYGAHLVYVYSVQQAPPPVFEDVRQDVLVNWQTEQQKKFNADFFETLKNRYEVVIAEVPADRLIDGRADKNLEDKSDAAAEPAS
jgi:peptidyl-prolyl cis-trans isomerase C